MQKKIYMARNGAPFKEEHAQEIGEFFEKNEGKTTEQLLSEIKKNKRSILYKCIEWDDKKASELFRLHQVRNIVNHITIQIDSIGDKLPIRAFFSVQDSPIGKQRVYVSLDTSFSNEFYRKQVIERAKIELQNWYERYKQYDELSGILRVIKTFVQKRKKQKS